MFQIIEEKAGDCGYFPSNNSVLERLFGNDLDFILSTCKRPIAPYDGTTISHCSRSEAPDQQERMNSVKLNINGRSFECKYIPKIANP